MKYTYIIYVYYIYTRNWFYTEMIESIFSSGGYCFFCHRSLRSSSSFGPFGRCWQGTVLNVVPAASVMDSLCKVRSLYTSTCAYSCFRNSSYYFQGKEKYSNGQGGREDLLGLSALMYLLQFVANVSQQTIYNVQYGPQFLKDWDKSMLWLFAGWSWYWPPGRCMVKPATTPVAPIWAG